MPHAPRSSPRYVGIPTFFRADYVPDPAPGQLDIGLIGLPFDGGTTNRPGARHGPRAVRVESTQFGTGHQELKLKPFERARIADVGDVWSEEPFELVAALGELERGLKALLATGLRPLAVGGDHSVTLPLLRAVAQDSPVGLVHLDAHGDTGDAYMGSRYHHGAPFRRAVEEGLLDPRRCVQIGLRGPLDDPDLWRFGREAGMRVVPMGELDQLGVPRVLEEVHRVTGSGPVHVSFDIDALDPAFACGTGTPVVGGMTVLQAQALLRGLRGLQVVSADLVEVSPPWDPSGTTALVAASLVFELLCQLTLALPDRARP